MPEVLEAIVLIEISNNWLSCSLSNASFLPSLSTARKACSVAFPEVVAVIVWSTGRKGAGAVLKSF